jgi:hypothetical protein
MDISNWGLHKIMQLPECCFGRRFLVSCTVTGGDAAAAWDISEIALPERCVLWEIRGFCDAAAADITSFRLALGDQLPVTTAIMDGLEPLINGLGAQGPGPRAIVPSLDGRMQWNRLRQNIHAASRRLILEATGAQGKTPTITVGIVISGVPRSIPDMIS